MSSQQTFITTHSVETQPGQLVPPELLIQHHAMDEEGCRTRASGGVTNAARRCLDAVRRD